MVGFRCGDTGNWPESGAERRQVGRMNRNDRLRRKSLSLREAGTGAAIGSAAQFRRPTGSPTSDVLAEPLRSEDKGVVRDQFPRKRLKDASQYNTKGPAMGPLVSIGETSVLDYRLK